MFTEAQKLHLIEEVIKTTDPVVLSELQAILERPSKKDKKAFSPHDLVGNWNKKDAALIEKAITEGCEQIHEDDWK